MRTVGVFEPSDPESAARAVTEALRGWSVRGGAARMWASSAAGHVAAGAAEWRLEYDPDLALVSFEVWAQQRRVFGIDDWLG